VYVDFSENGYNDKVVSSAFYFIKILNLDY